MERRGRLEREHRSWAEEPYDGAHPNEVPRATIECVPPGAVGVHTVPDPYEFVGHPTPLKVPRGRSVEVVGPEEADGVRGVHGGTLSLEPVCLADTSRSVDRCRASRP